MAGKGKGGAFERDLCRDLSLWWSRGKRDDIFWRTSGSGGRAKRRSGRSTFGQHGDIQATDPIGQPLIDLVTIEAKKGYNRSTPHDAIDCLPRHSAKHGRSVHHLQEWERFVEQAKEDSGNAGTPHWILIHKRDRRATIVFLQWRFFRRIAKLVDLPKVAPQAVLIRRSGERIFCCLWDDFKQVVRPRTVRKLATRIRRSRR